MTEELDILTPKAKFNFSLSLLNRLNELLKDCNDLSREKDLPSWRDTLKCLYRELSPLIDKKKISNYDKMMKEIFNIDIFKNPNIKFNGIGINKEEYNKLGAKLHDWEIELRKIINDNDMYMAKKDQIEHAIGDMED